MRVPLVFAFVAPALVQMPRVAAQAYRGRWGMVRAAALALMWCVAARAQTSCTVREERHWESQSGHFSVGTVHATVTLPTQIVTSHFPTVFLEVAGGDPAELFMEGGGVRVPLRHGAAMRLAPKAAERILFTLADGDGRVLCTWPPSFRHVGRQGLQRAPVFSGVSAWFFRNVGDPIMLSIGTDESREFRIGGIPAMVLSWTPWEVILRDPEPTVGSRTVNSQDAQITLRFIDVRVEISKPSPRGKATLTVTVPKLDLWGTRLWPLHPADNSTQPAFFIFNFHPEVLTLRCGYHHRVDDLDRDEGRLVRITEDHVHNGRFTYACPVTMHQQGKVEIDTSFEESRPRHWSDPARGERK